MCKKKLLSILGFIICQRALPKVKMFALSLSEIMLVACILGVVGELTIPNIVYGQYEITTISELKKTFAVFSSAFDKAVQEYGSPDVWGLVGAGNPVGLSNINDIMTKQFNVVQNCGTGVGCFPDVKYKNLSGTDNNIVLDQDSTYTKFRLADGSSVAVKQLNGDCSDKWGNSLALQSVCGLICFDINGNGGPNKYGEDFFGLAFTKFGLVPLGAPMQEEKYSFEDYCNKISDKTSAFPNGLSCTAWVMYRENMDYKSEYSLSWNNNNDKTNGNCGNGIGKGGHDGSGLGNGVGNTCRGNGNH